MKKTFLFLVLFLPLVQLHAQPPNSFNYQAVVRDISGDLITGESVNFRISINQTTASGTTVYQELQDAITNDFGLANFQIGTGGIVTIGDFSAIDWGQDDYFLKIEMSLNGGLTFEHMGTSQFNSVPYALYAESSRPTGGDGYLQFSYQNKFSWDSDLYWNNLNKMLGIGTNSPGHTLEVAGNAGFDQFLYHNDNVNTFIEFGYDRIQFTAGGVKFLDLNEASNDSIRFGDGSEIDFNFNNQMFLKGSSGRLGINTKYPTTYIDIEADGNGGIEINNNGDAYLILDKGAIADNNFIALRTGGSDKWVVGTWGSDDDFLIKNWPLSGSEDIAMSIKSSNSNIGLGTDNPGFRLDLYNTISDGIRAKTTNDSYLVIDKGEGTDNNFLSLRTDGSDKWVVGTWNSNEDFLIKNWGGGGSSDNTFFIDANSSSIGLNTTSPFATDMFTMSPDDDYNYGIYFNQNRSISGSLYSAYFIVTDTYSGTATLYGPRSDIEKDGTSASSIYGMRSFADDDQTGSTRYIYGMYATNSTTTTGTSVGYGVYGSSSINFDTQYGVYYSGNLAGSGTKSAVIRTKDGPKEVYCQESPGNWFEDFGSGTIQGGVGVVNISPDYLQTVTINQQDPMKVFITPNANIGNWWVQKREDSFIVHAPSASDGAKFDYRVVAKRQGYEDIRLRLAPAAYTDHLLYPNIEEVPAEHKEEWIRLVPVNERDPAWFNYVSSESRKEFEDEMRREQVQNTQQEKTSIIAEKSTNEKEGNEERPDTNQTKKSSTSTDSDKK